MALRQWSEEVLGDALMQGRTVLGPASKGELYEARGLKHEMVPHSGKCYTSLEREDGSLT